MKKEFSTIPNALSKDIKTRSIGWPTKENVFSCMGKLIRRTKKSERYGNRWVDNRKQKVLYKTRKQDAMQKIELSTQGVESSATESME